MELYMTEQQLQAVKTAYQQAQQRLLVFDHDGVLSPLKTDISAQASAPSTLLLRQLNTIATTPSTQVYVVSGRGKDTLQQWYGKYSAIGLSAEHGAWRNTNGVWQAQIEPFDALKIRLLACCNPLPQQCPAAISKSKTLRWCGTLGRPTKRRLQLPYRKSNLPCARL